MKIHLVEHGTFVPTEPSHPNHTAWNKLPDNPQKRVEELEKWRTVSIFDGGRPARVMAGDLVLADLYWDGSSYWKIEALDFDE